METETLERKHDVSAVFWLYLPLGSLALKLLAPLLGPQRWSAFMETELGFVENATAVFLIPAVILSILIFRRRRELPPRIGWIMLMLGLASLFFAGEEISWGQWYFEFKTPDVISEVNRQGEFNIHNTYSKYGGNLLNNIPRQILNLAMIVAIFLPIVFHKRMQAEGARKKVWYWLIPNYRLIPIALMAIVMRLPDKIGKIFSLQVPRDSYLAMSLIRASGEFKEYCFAIAILLYVLSIYIRMGRKRNVLAD
ncbi:MAG: hypothetical protein ACYSTL_08535 [Planctomycetota bacterium]